MTANDLVARYAPIAKAVARRFAWRWPSHADDFHAEAMLALVKAARRFNRARGVKFATYAHIRVVGACRDYQRTLIRYERKGQLAHHHRRNGVGLDRRRPDAGEEECDAMFLRERLLAALTPAQRGVVQAVLFDEMTQRQAGGLLGFTQPYCSVLLAAARCRMGEVLGEFRLAEARG